ncbi:MAG TPA: GAF and ANTAR domain-containing protein [Terriglobales bacterium]|nr:GAF and ANTAR domain-containing protein [Terriglobales bacterium]
MSVLGFDSSYLDSTDSGKHLHLVTGLSDHAKELGAAVANTFAIDSLHPIGSQIAAGETLDEVLASALRFIKALVHSDSSIAYVLQGGKFEPWVWQTREAVREPAPSLSQEVQRALAEHRVPIALSRDLAEDRRVRVFHQWSRDSGESFVSVPLLSRKNLVGAINFRHAPRAYSEREVKLLSTIGFIIGADIGISLAEAENAMLREDLETRKLVERGKGLLQRDFRVSEQQTYLILEHLSRQRRKSMEEVARAIILGDEVKRGAAAS